MASGKGCIALWARGSLSASSRPHLRLSPHARSVVQQHRTAVVVGGTSANAAKYKRNKMQAQAAKKKKARTTYIQYDLRDAEQYSLCDAMRYLQAAEVGHPLSSPKYELSLRLRSVKNGPIVRNRLRLPYPVKTDLRIAVICPPGSKAATDAEQSGASLIGEAEIFDAVKAGKIDFDRCICHADSLVALQKAGVARILGPRGLMPSPKTGTVTKNVGSVVRDMVGGSEYKERDGSVRMAIGQLGFGPEELRRNIKAFIENIKKDMASMSHNVTKELHEVVLSSTHGPGFSLNGQFRSDDSPTVRDLTPIPVESTTLDEVLGGCAGKSTLAMPTASVATTAAKQLSTTSTVSDSPPPKIVPASMSAPEMVS